MSRNLHQLYYKEYFKGLDFSFLLENKKKEASSSVKKAIKEKNDALCEPNQLQPIPSPANATHTLQFNTLYPGLATGVGIGHEAKIEGEFKLGMHFNWTYGMPVVYGSSVKGVLRSYFKDFYHPQTDDKEEEVDKLKVDIFGEDKKDKKKGYKNEKSIYDRDIFFDAVIVKPDQKGRILCPDSITPHVQGPLKNPIPITFMKIAPGCVIEFRFRLVDSEIRLKNGKTVVLKAEEKRKIFKTILTTVGIGAKTNVGYGQLESK